MTETDRLYVRMEIRDFDYVPVIIHGSLVFGHVIYALRRRRHRLHQSIRRVRSYPVRSAVPLCDTIDF